MKYLSILAGLFLLAGTASAQTLSVSPVAAHSGFSESEFPLKTNSIHYSGDMLRFGGETHVGFSAWGVSPQGNVVGLLKPGVELSLLLTDETSAVMAESELEFFDPNDETLALYPFGDGRVIARDNVANFTFFNPRGRTLFSVSNSSQSPDGEQRSQLASDPDGSTIVLYNPVISYGETSGSRARIIFGEDEDEEFFRDHERTIEDVRVSNSGSFITLLSSGSGNAIAYVYDRFGNQITEFELDDDQRGASLSENGEFITVYSQSRVQVYNLLTGERLGSSSMRHEVLYATYDPAGQMLLAFGGSERGGSVYNPMLTAVHLGQRQIAREEIGGTLAKMQGQPLQIERNGASRYLLKGLNRHLEISAQF